MKIPAIKFETMQRDELVDSLVDTSPSTGRRVFANTVVVATIFPLLSMCVPLSFVLAVVYKTRMYTCTVNVIL